MPRGAVPEWRKRKEPIVDDWILASVQRAGGLGKHHPETGHYGELVISDLADRDEADEYRRALYRCAHYMNRRGIAPLSISADRSVRGIDGRYSITFRAVDKTLARAHVLARYGNDRSKWPYDPRRRTALWVCRITTLTMGPRFSTRSTPARHPRKPKPTR